MINKDAVLQRARERIERTIIASDRDILRDLVLLVEQSRAQLEGERLNSAQIHMSCHAERDELAKQSQVYREALVELSGRNCEWLAKPWIKQALRDADEKAGRKEPTP